MGLRQFLAGTGLVIVFGIAVYMFLIGMVSQNNPSSDIFYDPQLNQSLNPLQDRATELQELGGTSKTLLMERSEPSLSYIYLIVYSALAIPLGFVLFLTKSIFTIMGVLWNSLVGIGGSSFDIVFGAITSILIITIVILVMRAIRTGETEK